MSKQTLKDLRAEIDMFDSYIAWYIQQRAETSRKAQRHRAKKTVGRSQRDIRRENAVVAGYVQWLEWAGISQTKAAEIAFAILDACTS
jgi:chorismate mutase